jgi:hypothetical protein
MNEIACAGRLVMNFALADDIENDLIPGNIQSKQFSSFSSGRASTVQ